MKKQDTEKLGKIKALDGIITQTSNSINEALDKLYYAEEEFKQKSMEIDIKSIYDELKTLLSEETPPLDRVEELRKQFKKYEALSFKINEYKKEYDECVNKNQPVFNYAWDEIVKEWSNTNLSEKDIQSARVALYNYINYSDSIRVKQNELKEIKILLSEVENTLKAYSISDTHSTTNAVSDSTSASYIKTINLIESYNQLINEIEESIKNIIQNKETVNNVLDKINQDNRVFLELRYIKQEEWDRISALTNYEERQCRRKSEEGLVQFISIYKNIS